MRYPKARDLAFYFETTVPEHWNQIILRLADNTAK
jgi:hypothetical protein